MEFKLPKLETVIEDGLQNLDIGLIALDGSCPDLDDDGLLEEEGLAGSTPIDSAFPDELPLELDYETASAFGGPIPSFQEAALRESSMSSPKPNPPKANRGPRSAKRRSAKKPSAKKSGLFGFFSGGK
jgi:hypothetical protein